MRGLIQRSANRWRYSASGYIFCRYSVWRRYNIACLASQFLLKKLKIDYCCTFLCFDKKKSIGNLLFIYFLRYPWKTHHQAYININIEGLKKTVILSNHNNAFIPPKIYKKNYTVAGTVSIFHSFCVNMMGARVRRASPNIKCELWSTR